MVEEKINNAQFNVGIYIRLSQEDDDKKYESDSESVINQRTLLKNYVKENNFSFIDEYVDDGFTGTVFDRPGFKRLLDDIEKRRINTVIDNHFVHHSDFLKRFQAKGSCNKPQSAILGFA